MLPVRPRLNWNSKARESRKQRQGGRGGTEVPADWSPSRRPRNSARGDTRAYQLGLSRRLPALPAEPAPQPPVPGPCGSLLHLVSREPWPPRRGPPPTPCPGPLSLRLSQEIWARHPWAPPKTQLRGILSEGLNKFLPNDVKPIKRVMWALPYLSVN